MSNSLGVPTVSVTGALFIYPVTDLHWMRAGRRTSKTSACRSGVLGLRRVVIGGTNTAFGGVESSVERGQIGDYLIQPNG